MARLSDAEYEWVQHVDIATAAGVTPAQIQALEHGTDSDPCFDATEQLVLRFTAEVVRDVGASAATFAAMAERFSPREIVELILAIGFYMMMARLMRTLEIDIEPAAGAKVVAAAR